MELLGLSLASSLKFRLLKLNVSPSLGLIQGDFLEIVPRFDSSLVQSVEKFLMSFETKCPNSKIGTLIKNFTLIHFWKTTSFQFLLSIIF